MKDRYYIKSSGILKRKDNSLYFENDHKKIRIPIESVYDIFAEEGVSLSSGVLKLFKEKNIILHSFDYYNNYVGCFIPKQKVISGKCIIEQSEHYIDDNKRLTLAKLFVKGSIENMRLNLLRYRDKCCNNAEKLKNIKTNIDSINTIPQLMQLEGEARKKYYECFNHQINDFEFEYRSKQPPENELNAVMSYLNMVLYSAIITELYHTRLNQTISYLHEPHERRYSLSLDISEIFKPMIVDRLIILLFNKKILNKNDFEKKGKAVLLSESGRVKVMDEFKKRMESTRKHPNTRKNHSMRRWLRMECHKITKHILNIREYKYTTIR